MNATAGTINAYADGMLVKRLFFLIKGLSEIERELMFFCIVIARPLKALSVIRHLKGAEVTYLVF